MSLGQDFGADAMAAFSGELYDATLSRFTATGYDVNNATGAPTGDAVVYDCEGIAFAFEQREVDGTRILKSDYRVTILRASLAVIPQPGDIVSIPPPGGTVAADARVIHVDAVTEAQVTVHVRGVPA